MSKILKVIKTYSKGEQVIHLYFDMEGVISSIRGLYLNNK